MPTTKSSTDLEQLVDVAIEGGEKLLEMALDVQDVLPRREMSRLRVALDALRRRDQPGDALYDLLICATNIGVAWGDHAARLAADREHKRQKAAADACANPWRPEVEAKLLAGSSPRAIAREYGIRVSFSTARTWQRKLRDAGKLRGRRTPNGRGRLRLAPGSI